MPSSVRRNQRCVRTAYVLRCAPRRARRLMRDSSLFSRSPGRHSTVVCNQGRKKREKNLNVAPSRGVNMYKYSPHGFSVIAIALNYVAGLKGLHPVPSLDGFSFRLGAAR